MWMIVIISIAVGSPIGSIVATNSRFATKEECNTTLLEFKTAYLNLDKIVSQNLPDHNLWFLCLNEKGEQ